MRVLMELVLGLVMIALGVYTWTNQTSITRLQEEKGDLAAKLQEAMQRGDQAEAETAECLKGHWRSVSSLHFWWNQKKSWKKDDEAEPSESLLVLCRIIESIPATHRAEILREFNVPCPGSGTEPFGYFHRSLPMYVPGPPSGYE